jgi:hypothetical protein
MQANLFQGKTRVTIVARGILAGLCVAGVLSSTTVGLRQDSEEIHTDRIEISLIVSCIWQGNHLHAFNLAALQELRTKFPNLKLTHFVSPAYFARVSENERRGIAQTIRSNVLSRDEIGMALQGWKSLMQEARVEFKSGPTFWGNRLLPTKCQKDCGAEVPLNIYSEEELARILRTGSKLLEDNGFNRPRNLFVAGWMASNNVLEVAAAHGFTYDYSAVNASVLSELLRPYPLYTWLKQTWPMHTKLMESYTVHTDTSTMTEVGTAAVLDYMDSDELVAEFKRYLKARRKGKDEAPVFNLMIHQETIHEYSYRFEEALQRMQELAAEAQVVLKAIALPGDIGNTSQGIVASTKQK